jgi:DNA-nicking Smr family endonuclease
MNGDESASEFSGPVQLPIEGVLDLHTFRPQDIKELVPAYLEACRERGLLKVRIVHGKGIGNLRRTVHALLSRLPEVESYALASAPFGGWGATIVCLRPLTHPS